MTIRPMIQSTVTLSDQFPIPQFSPQALGQPLSDSFISRRFIPHCGVRPLLNPFAFRQDFNPIGFRRGCQFPVKPFFYGPLSDSFPIPQVSPLPIQSQTYSEGLWNSVFQGVNIGPQPLKTESESERLWNLVLKGINIGPRPLQTETWSERLLGQTDRELARQGIQLRFSPSGESLGLH